MILCSADSLIDFNDCSQVELASLANKVGQFLSLMEHFKEAEEILLDAHHSLYEVCKVGSSQLESVGIRVNTFRLTYITLREEITFLVTDANAFFILTNTTTLQTSRLRGDQIEVFQIFNGYKTIDRNIFFSLKKIVALEDTRQH